MSGSTSLIPTLLWFSSLAAVFFPSSEKVFQVLEPTSVFLVWSRLLNSYIYPSIKIPTHVSDSQKCLSSLWFFCRPAFVSSIVSGATKSLGNLQYSLHDLKTRVRLQWYISFEACMIAMQHTKWVNQSPNRWEICTNMCLPVILLFYCDCT